MLIAGGYSVKTATSGRVAREIIESERFDEYLKKAHHDVPAGPSKQG